MKQLNSTTFLNVKYSGKKSVPGLLQNFSPNPGTFQNIVGPRGQEGPLVEPLEKI